jgi:hypothetical protein
MYPHISPYSYCEGNPIMLIDPNGMNTIRNNQEDAIAELDASNASRNVLIAIRNGDKVFEYDKIKKGNPDVAYDGWHVITATDIEDANTQLQSYMSDNDISELDNLVISAHGNTSSMYITKEWISNSKKINALDFNNIMFYGKDNTGVEPAIVNGVNALAEVVKTVKKDGNLVFTNCNNGGDGNLSKYVHTALNSNINVYNNLGSGLVFGKESGRLNFNSLSSSSFIHHTGKMVGNIDIFDNKQKPIVIHP